MMRLIDSSDGPTCRSCGDWIEIHDGKPVCKSGCETEPTLPELDSIEDGPIDGYDY